MKIDPIRILTYAEARKVTRCQICDTPLTKGHPRKLYCSRVCRNRAHRARRGIEPRPANMTPALYELLDGLREAANRERSDH